MDLILNKETYQQVEEKEIFLQQKRNRTSYSDEDQFKNYFDDNFNMTLEKRQEINKIKVDLFNEKYKIMRIDYDLIKRFEYDVEFQGMNSIDMMICFDQYNGGKPEEFIDWVDGIVKELNKNMPMSHIRISLMGQVVIDKKDVMICIEFIDTLDEEKIKKKVENILTKAVSSSSSSGFMIEEEESLNDILHKIIVINWKSYEKTLFFLSKPNKTIALSDKNIIAYANKGIDICFVVTEDINNTLKSQLEDRRLTYLKETINTNNTFNIKIMQLNEDKDTVLLKYITNELETLLKNSLYKQEYIDEIFRKFKLDTFEYITEKYNIDLVTFIKQIDSMTFTLEDKEKNKIALMTRCFSKCSLIDNQSTNQSKSLNELDLNNHTRITLNDPIERIESKEDFSIESIQNEPNLNLARIPLSIIHTFANRNLIKATLSILPYDLSFSSIHSCICYSMKLIEYPKESNYQINWLKPQCFQYQTKSIIKLSENVYQLKDLFSIAAYDYLFTIKGIATIPLEVKRIEYNLTHFLKQLASYSLCEFIGDKFNLFYYQRFPHLHSNSWPIYFNKCSLYEMEDYNSKYLLFNELPSYNSDESDKNTNNLPRNIKDAFSHFSYQLSEGNMMITDIKDINGTITNQKINTMPIDEDYKAMISFFLRHSCNEICKQMNLIHPNTEGDKDNEFIDKKWYDNITYNPNGPFICNLCHTIHQLKEHIESMCSECYKKNNASLRKVKCDECHIMFEHKNYCYIQLRMSTPTICNECRSCNIDQ